MSNSSTPDTSPGSKDATPLSLATEDLGSALVVHVAGEIDMNTSPALRDHLAGVFAKALTTPVENRPTLVVDLGDVTFLASIGLSVLVANHHDAAAGNIPMLVVVSSRAVRRSIAAAQLDRLLTLHPTVEDALSTVPAR